VLLLSYGMEAFFYFVISVLIENLTVDNVYWHTTKYFSTALDTIAEI
jgi:hypothetical protein